MKKKNSFCVQFWQDVVIFLLLSAISSFKRLAIIGKHWQTVVRIWQDNIQNNLSIFDLNITGWRNICSKLILSDSEIEFKINKHLLSKNEVENGEVILRRTTPYSDNAVKKKIKTFFTLTLAQVRKDQPYSDERFIANVVDCLNDLKRDSVRLL